MPKPSACLRELSGREAWKSKSRRWGGGGGGGGNNKSFSGGVGRSEGKGGSFQHMEGLQSMYGNNNGGGGGGGFETRKRLMVVVDDSSHSKHAMMWALTHVANRGDLLTLLHIIPSCHDFSSSPCLANSLSSLCKACKPEVEVEALVIQGPRLATVISQVKKLEVSVLVLGQKKPSPLISCLFGSSSSRDLFVEHCINNAECLTIGVRKQSKGVSGYLINTRWQKDFWLLA
ncbi:hypothetical protein D8674_033925 [Pyrus ussuriensis x Pyrus communis]|uniref:UspA domain-containing protein n=1 Tax=Pyrus ussuriensis x Pyrus communis TaxID=2448454 RepID=A0A5N5HUB2_9ROSA|nr:hypothetical protein D8674_033925 [Pyrus ussuriensis x Pyrus communis]